MPTPRAMIGVPRNLMISPESPVMPAMVTMEDSAMSAMGTMIGASVLNPEGSLP